MLKKLPGEIFKIHPNTNEPISDFLNPTINHLIFHDVHVDYKTAKQYLEQALNTGKVSDCLPFLSHAIELLTKRHSEALFTDGQMKFELPYLKTIAQKLLDEIEALKN